MRWLLAAILLGAAMSGASAAPYDVVEKSIVELNADLAAGRVTSEQLVWAYLDRIEKIDRNGPTLNSVIAVNPDALADARGLDAERQARGPRGPLHGIPILVKDNIETAEMPTTAGSLALAGNFTHRDAPLIARLRAAGAIILGKTNLSEWANIRSTRSISGWSAVGGLVRNPYVLDRSACGSSSGSAAAVAASLAAAAIGTETDGSIVCPSSLNGIVGLKPTVGLVSRTFVIPIAHSQDTPGPMTRTVADAAILLAAMAGTDAADAATAEADAHRADYAASLANAALQGKRLGVIVPDPTASPTDTDLTFAKAVAAMKSAGADIVEIHDNAELWPDAGQTEITVLLYELKNDLNAYLATLPPGMTVRSLADVIAFNAATPRELSLFGQDLFERAQALGDLSAPAYLTARDALKAKARARLDALFQKYRLDALIRATDEPAFRLDVVKGDNDSSNASFLPAAAGYPHITVPMGLVHALPVGLSFIGPAWTEAKVLAIAAAFEATQPARAVPAFIPSLEAGPEMRRALSPLPR